MFDKASAIVVILARQDHIHCHLGYRMGNQTAVSGSPKSGIKRSKVDLSQVPTVPFAYVDEHTYARIRACSEKVVQRERQEGIGCKFIKINGKTVRYRMGDIFEFLQGQPGGGGNIPTPKPGPGRPRKAVALK